jgi:thiamine kinase-like enzyme
MPTEEALKQLLQASAKHFASFVDRLGDRLSRERHDLYERYLEATPRLRARLRSRRNLTVIHADAHVWNFLLPRTDGDDVRIFDWDSWRPGLASNDLAYMMAMHWYPDRRRQLERPLLDHYHAALVAHGVQGYDRRALDDDYRLSVLFQMMIPVWQAAIDIPPAVWWSHLERIMLAVDDLGCRELLD